MLRCTSALWCAAANISFSAWIERLAHEAESITKASCDASSETSLWTQLESVAGEASALKETDTVFSIVQCLWRSGCYPPQLPQWTKLAERLLMHADTEYRSVLSYPGVPDAELRRSHSLRRVPRLLSEEVNSGVPVTRSEYYVPVSRESLVLTGGVVPLSSRLPAADGVMLNLFLDAFLHYLTNTPGDYRSIDRTLLEETLTGLNQVIINVLRAHSHSMALRNFSSAMDRYIALLSDCDAHMGTTLMKCYVEALISQVPANGLGPCLAVSGFAYLTASHHATSDFAKAVADGSQAGAILPLLKTVTDAFYDGYTTPHDGAPMTPSLNHLKNFLEATLQHNAIMGNRLKLSDDADRKVRDSVLLGMLRAMRVEATAPDVFLRDSIPLIDKCSPSMSVESELIHGKVSLLSHFDLNDAATEAIYEDILNSLHNFVELRPRALSLTSEKAPDLGDPDDSLSGDEVTQVTLDHRQQGLMQQTHEAVIQLFCSSHNSKRINDAYNIVVAHKYHGLQITKEIIGPLVDVLSLRGDGRVFNLVDVCVLYSNQAVDMHILSGLFRACAVAGDLYRAQVLLRLLVDVVPGLLLKAPADLKDSLRELQLLPMEAFHLFVSEEERLVKSALGFTAEALRELPPSKTKAKTT